jgi:glycerol-3-phosphate dehydrogenase
MVALEIDLLVVGGGIHGAGIARDAAGRGLRVLLAEQGDLAGATSSASSKLAHGGLRYLERFDLRLVREALHERETLMRIAPHLVRPLSFFLPMSARTRPGWQVRAGLLLYDLLAGRSSLPRSRALDLSRSDEGRFLQPHCRRGFCYWDGWADDARLVVANALDAAQRGAVVMTRTRCEHVVPSGPGWQARLVSAGAAPREVRSRAVVNATGPWVDTFLRVHTPLRPTAGVRLVQGGHLAVRRKVPGGRALLLQNDDGRVVFVLPFEDDLALIGTTDVPVSDAAGAQFTDAEARYLCHAVNGYLAEPIAPADTIWSTTGVRALYDDGSANPSRISRDYVLQLDRGDNGAPMLSVFGGKLTTYRRLSEEVLAKLSQAFPQLAPAWTAGATLPGGDLGGMPLARWCEALVARYPGLPPDWVTGIGRRHGALAQAVLGEARSPEALGVHFGAGLTQRELDYLVRNEWARDADDVLWRRTKTGVHLDAAQRQAVADALRRAHPARGTDAKPELA